MASTTSGVFELLTGSSSPLLASGDVVCFVDVSDTTQAAQGSLVKGTMTQFFAAIPVPVVVTSASANALAVGLAGSSNSAFLVDCSTALQVAGLKVTGAVTGGTVAVVVTDSGLNANLTVNAKGSGTIGIGSVSTGRVTITPVTTITGLLTLTAGVVGPVAFTTDLISTTALATPSALAATQFTAFASTVSGAVLMGFGTTFDATLKNRAGTDVIGVTANTTGVVFAGAVSGITTLAGTGAVSGFTGATFDNAASRSLLTLGNSTSGFSTVRLLAGSTHYGWQISANDNINQALEITPSTAVGGTTFSTPALSILGSTGVVTLGQGLTVSAGTTAVQALTAAGIIRNDGASGGFAMGVVSSVPRITYNSGTTSFAFLTAGNGDATLTTGHLYAETDASFDIGQSGSLLRYRNLFLSGAATLGGGISCTTGTFSGDITGVVNLTSSSGTLSGFDSISGTHITGTLNTAVQASITTVGTLGSLAVTNVVTAGQLKLTGAPGTAAAGQVFFGSSVQTTIGANGAASALTANPVGYLLINVAGTNRIIPYYNA